MTSAQYVILAYVIALGLLWGSAAMLWLRLSALRKRQRADGDQRGSGI